MGLTPSMSLTNGIRRHALNASRAWGSTSSEANFLARSATASQSSAGLLLSCLVQRILSHNSVPAPEGPAAPLIYGQDLERLDIFSNFEMYYVQRGF